MAVFRIEKTKNYTVMSNYHFKEKTMSLKAKGLLSLMLSLPDDWDYSIAGLVAICKENETSIKSTLDELKQFGYLEVKKLLPNQTATGRIEYEYIIYEHPKNKQEDKKQEVEKQGVENLGVEFLGVENQGQLNIKELNTEELNTEKPNTKKYIYYGEYNRIKLTEEEYQRLCNEFTKEFIDEQITLLDEYVESNNNKNKYTNFNLVLRRAIREKWFKGGNNNAEHKGNNKQYEYPDLPRDRGLF